MREKKLQTLQTKQNKAQSDITAEFKRIVAEFKETVSDGVKINNVDDVIVQISNIDSLSKEVTELKKALGDLVFPEYEKEVEVKGLDDLVRKIPSEVKVEWLNEDKLKILVDKLGAIQTEIKGALVSEVDQAPDNYQPFRRVRKVGNALMYDDSSWGGSPGGGSSTGGSSSGLTDEQLRASPIETNSNIQVNDAPVSGANPVEVTGTVTATGAQLDIEDALTLSSYNLASAAYSSATSIGTDYLLSSLFLRFSTAESKTITITSSDGAIIYNSGATTAQNIAIPFGTYINASENVTLAITQTSGACTVSGKLTIAQGSVALGGTAIVNIRGDGGIFGSNTDTDNAVTSDGELMISESERERNVWVDFEQSAIGATKWAVLIDLSDTTNFPHDATGRLDLSVLRISIDRGTFNGQVRWGVITAINGTQATIKYFKTTYIDSSQGSSFIEERNYAPSQIKLSQTAGVLTRGITNISETTTSVNTGTALDSPLGTATVNPGVGDIIIKVTRASGTLTNVATFALYHSEETA